MKLIGDYHTHTTFSHGSGTIEDNLKAAIQKELAFVGISDHGPAHILHGLKRSELPVMRREVDRLNEKYSAYGTKVLLGVEANVTSFKGDIDVRPSDLQYYDFLLLGYHYMTRMLSWKDAWQWYIANSVDQWIIKRETYRQYITQALIQAVQRYPITAVTHPGAKVHLDLQRLADACFAADTALEVNEKNHHLNVAELILLREHEVPLLVSSDAHRPEDVGCIEQVRRRLQEAGISTERIINGR